MNSPETSSYPRNPSQPDNQETPNPHREGESKDLPYRVILSTKEMSESAEQPLTQSVGFAEQPYPGDDQDAILFDTANNLYGVFDGLGVHSDSARAARLAAVTVRGQMAENKSRDPAEVEILLVSALEKASSAILDDIRHYGEDKDIGGTTSTVVKIVEQNNTKYLAWASVGDSRIYIKHPYDDLELITQDETEDYHIDNALGKFFRRGVSQHGYLEVMPGSVVALVTDGITGSYGESALEDYELQDVLDADISAQMTAEMLLAISRKEDDKAVVVLRF